MDFDFILYVFATWLIAIGIVLFMIIIDEIMSLECHFAVRYFQSCGIFDMRFVAFHELLMVIVIGFPWLILTVNPDEDCQEHYVQPK